MEAIFENLWKTALAFFSILVYARILGKEQISHLTFYDYVTGITFGGLAAELALAERESVVNVFMVLTIFVAFAFFMSYVTLKNRPLRKIIEGEPVIVIHNGKILEKNMGRMRYNTENLITQLREKGYFNIKDIEYAVLETNGSLSILPKSQKRPLTPADMQIPTKYEGLSTEIIIDGKIIYPNLEQNNLDEQWLITELKKQGVNNPADVFHASLDTEGNLFLDMKMDDVQNLRDITDSKPMS